MQIQVVEMKKLATLQLHRTKKPLYLTALHNRICTTQDTMSHQLEEVILQPPQDLVPQLIGKSENKCKSYLKLKIMKELVRRE